MQIGDSRAFCVVDGAIGGVCSFQMLSLALLNNNR
jgi:hypothetical protein